MDLFEQYYNKLTEELTGYIVHLESENGFKFARSITATSEEDAKEMVAKEYPNAKILNVSIPSQYDPDKEVKRYDYQNLDIEEALHISKDDTSIWRNVKQSIIAFYKDHGQEIDKEVAERFADYIIDGLHNIAKNSQSDDLQDDILAIDRQIKGNK